MYMCYESMTFNCITVCNMFVVCSETGNKPPESCIFGQLLNISAVIGKSTPQKAYSMIQKLVCCLLLRGQQGSGFVIRHASRMWHTNGTIDMDLTFTVTRVNSSIRPYSNFNIIGDKIQSITAICLLWL